MMKHIFILFAVLTVAGCESLTGRYAPACTAFEGDTIELENGRFVWKKFTDEVEIDASGNKIDKFPDYPKTGVYSLSASELELTSDDGVALATYYLLAVDGENYLLTAAEQGRYAIDGMIERCALRRTSDE